ANQLKTMPSQNLLPTHLEVTQSIEVSGLPIEVGVLPDGMPFLSGRGLAKACGISNSTLVGWGELTPQIGDKYRAGKMAALLATYGYYGDRLFVRVPDGVKFAGKANVSAYPYQVCMAFLDYYCFEANKEDARNSLRILSEKQLPQFIYEATGYQPPKVASAPQRPVRDRPSDDIANNYFSVVQAISAVKLRSMQTGLLLGSQAISHVSIEQAWSRYWDTQKLWDLYGERFPRRQRESTAPLRLMPMGAVKTYIYPIAALDQFKQWLNSYYIPERFPSYLQRKINQRPLAVSVKYLPQASR
ncbi:MAG: hypothetical protein AAGA01_17665, partial [Cyanobacteria bacterium P01_E01_bin.43]